MWTASSSEDALTFTVARDLPVPVERVWREMARPGHLVDCHPFCAAHTAERWPGVGSRDAVRFHNGKVLYRNFHAWEEGIEYAMTVTDEADVEVADVAFSVAQATVRGHSTMRIEVTPLFDPRIPRFARRSMWRLGLRRLTVRYFTCVLKGFEYHLSTGRPVRPNQFGRHPQYS
jgi:hypothetical protein